MTRTIVEQPVDAEFGYRELDKVRVHQETGSVVAGFGPHVVDLDPIYVNDSVLIPELRLSQEQVFAWFISVKFTGRFPKVKTIANPELVKRHAKRRNMELIEVVQPYLIKGHFDENGIEGVIEREEAFDINKAAYERAGVLLDTPGSIIGISPETTRRRTGGVHRGVSTVGRLLDPEKHPNAAYLPIYLDGAHALRVPSAKGFRQATNLTSPLRIKIGHLITGAELDEMRRDFAWRDPAMRGFTRADAMMMHLLNRPLSPWMRGQDPRGVYAWDNIRDLGLEATMREYYETHPEERPEEYDKASHELGPGVLL